MSKIDFERAQMLLSIIVEAGKHGPLFQRLASEAGNELKEMVAKLDDRGPERAKVITPAAGPANSALRRPDGSVEPLVPQQPQRPLPPGEPVRPRAIPSTPSTPVGATAPMVTEPISDADRRL